MHPLETARAHALAERSANPTSTTSPASPTRPPHLARPARTGCTLTICFDDPFWIALVERIDADGYSVAHHVFGTEPTDPQVHEFALADWGRLRFTSPQGQDETERADSSRDPWAFAADRRINPKRMQRLAKKQMRSAAGVGTKAQQALAAQRDATKVERRAASREQREQEAAERYRKRREKKRQKARGH
ncbi:MAG: YjdF family protein [Coriobacteriia bacterium]|nr:YjdF family protein [Coriobacteriia bacterium]